MAGNEGIGGIFRDMLEPGDTEVLYGYGDTFYKEFAAVTRKQQGRGQIYYIGCGIDENTMNVLMNQIMDDAGIAKEETPSGLEIAYRGAAANKVRMIMNHNDYEVEYNGQTIAPYESKIEIV